MFRRTPANRQSDIFSGYESHLSQSKREKLTDPKVNETLKSRWFEGYMGRLSESSGLDATA